MHYSKEEKAQWLEDWKQSGKGAWSYAKGIGLCPQTFVRWTKPKRESAGNFVEVPIKATPRAPYSEGILIEKGGLRIHIPLVINSGELCTILNALIEGV